MNASVTKGLDDCARIVTVWWNRIDLMRVFHFKFNEGFSCQNACDDAFLLNSWR